jgi:hypothetical protein
VTAQPLESQGRPGAWELHPGEIAKSLPERERALFLSEYQNAMVEATHDVWRYKHLQDVLHTWHLQAIAMSDPAYWRAKADVENGDMTHVVESADFNEAMRGLGEQP